MKFSNFSCVIKTANIVRQLQMTENMMSTCNTWNFVVLAILHIVSVVILSKRSPFVIELWPHNVISRRLPTIIVLWILVTNLTILFSWAYPGLHLEEILFFANKVLNIYCILATSIYLFTEKKKINFKSKAVAHNQR